MKIYDIKLGTVKEPPKDLGVYVELSAETIQERKQKILRKMEERQLDQLIVYGDVEHGSNFEYLVGFFTRFEEALLVIHKNGEMNLLLGNENLNKAAKARIKAQGIHVSLFSLPNQPNRKDKTFHEILLDAGIQEKSRIGLVGWKMFTSSLEDNKHLYDIPYYIVDEIKQIAGDGMLSNETDLFIGEDGVRTTNNANEIAHYEYGASLASDCILDAMNALNIGVKEYELGNMLVRNGQHTSVVTIASSGPRFINGNMYPTNNTVKLGDPISLTVGYRGGSSSRAGYAVHDEDELPAECKNYLNAVAIPYYQAYIAWLEKIKIGMSGNDLFQIIEMVLPRLKYGWTLCPGHLTGEEEWMSSPVYEGSSEILKSGMIFQIDIIPSVPGYSGCCAESTVVLADEHLKNDIKEKYPQLWDRMQNRIHYLKNELGICLSEDVLPMCGSVAYLRPFLLAKDKALVKSRP